MLYVNVVEFSPFSEKPGLSVGSNCDMSLEAVDWFARPIVTSPENELFAGP